MVQGYVAGDVTDYQMSAMLMAVCCRGMTAAETEALTRSMIASGETVTLGNLHRPTVDKHSTGGVGDKTTLVVAPLAAACGAAVPKLSGRGLGNTGGTLDKLESIPGFRVDLALPELVEIAARAGVAVAAPTGDIVPADRRMYALRDATGTVESLPLIASSIMSKKLAVGTDAIVLDVKVGEGGFFPDVERGRAFATTAIALGAGFGRRVRCLITAMERPLGRAVGNALEVREAMATLRGEGPADFTELCSTVAGEMVLACGLANDAGSARDLVRQRLQGGDARRVFEEWISAQGGELATFERLPEAARQIEVTAAAAGHVSAVHAREIGHLAMLLGAGRERKEDGIDHAAGIVLEAGIGDAVTPGAVLATLHTNRPGDSSGWELMARSAFEVSEHAVARPPVIIDLVEEATQHR